LEKSTQVGPGAFSAAGLRETANTRCSSFTASERKTEEVQGHIRRRTGKRKEDGVMKERKEDTEREREREREKEKRSVHASCRKQK